MDIVFIEALEIDTVIGIYDWERQITQKVVLDIEMAFDNRRPAASDDIVDTLNYKDVSKRLIAFVGESNFGLVESDYAWVTQHLLRTAQLHCQGRVVSVLEGGYDLSSLARSVAAHVKVLADA